MNAKTTRIETLVAELATCTTSAMRRCVVDSLFAAIGQDSSLASHASDSAAAIGYTLRGIEAARMYDMSSSMNEHRHVINSLRIGLDHQAAEHIVSRDRDLHAAIG
jgi:hypothetical protein